MKVCGVIAEYNPFHNGHKLHLDAIKEQGASVVAVMSGNYVQRCETAVFSKRYRAMTALLNGADLVIELPLAYATASAEKFAFGGVYLLNSLGVVDTLSFGSESGDINELSDLVRAIQLPETDRLIKSELEKGISYPTARQNALSEIVGNKLAAIVEKPNNILGIEYIKAINNLNCPFAVQTTKRFGVMHDSSEATGAITSASAVRNMIYNGDDYSLFVPESTFEIIENAKSDKCFPSDFGKLETAVLSFLRQATADCFSNIPDVSEGIENRIITAAKTAKSFDELFSLAKTKRYTYARIRRIVLRAFLGITDEYYNEPPQYIRVLGFNRTGREILKQAKGKTTLPVVMSASDIKKLPEKAQKQFELECRSTDIFNITLPEIRQCGTEMTDNIIKFE